MALTAVQVLAKFRDALLALDEFAEAGGFEEMNKGTGPAPKKETATRASKKTEPVAEPDDDTETEIPSEEEVAKMSIKELRELAKALGLSEQMKKTGILDELDELRGGDDEDAEDDDEEYEEEEDEDTDEDEADDAEDEEEEDDEEDAEDAEEDGYTREELEGKSLNELRALAKSENISPTKYRGLDVEGLIDLLVPDADDDEEPEDDDAEDESDEQELDEEALKAMSTTELLELAKELGVKIPASISKLKGIRAKRAEYKSKLVDHILDSAGEEDDE